MKVLKVSREYIITADASPEVSHCLPVEQIRPRSPEDIEDMYANVIHPAAHIPPPGHDLDIAPELNISPPGSPAEEGRQLGLYDDPNDLDVLQRSLGEDPTEDEEQEPVEAQDPGHLRLSPQPQPLDDGLGRPPSPDAAEPDAHDVAIPGISQHEHPALAHALHLPSLPPSLSPHAVYSECHALWYVRIVLLLVAYLHTHHHVTFRAADLTLSTLRMLFIALGLIDALDPMPRTLTTTLKRLNLTDKFHILIECTGCRLLFRPNIKNYRFQCIQCDTPLFTTTPRTLLMRLLRLDAPTPIPRTVAPMRLLSSALAYLISQPGIEAYFEAWTTRPAPPSGEYRSIHDGSRWKTLLGCDGKPFFGPDYDGELRVPVILHVDWFSAASSAFSASYSTGAISFSLPTLPPALRYRVEYLILAAMTDGPKEPDAEELQHWIALIVDDLLMLYHRGRRCRVVVICACTDHPAMCKVGGFADKSHNEVPCTAGTTSTKDMYSDECLQGGCPPRSYQQHWENAQEWKALETRKECDEHFKKHGSRWADIMRLPYYDCIKMTVIDPMHNLLLGVVKTQWYTRWIKTAALRAETKAGNKRELSMMHTFLDTFEVPEWVGRLPFRVGEPAGGSLSADEYKHLMIGPGCIILPIIWHHFADEVKTEHAKAMKKHAVAEVLHTQAVSKHAADIAAVEAKLQTADASQEEKLTKRLSTLRARTPAALPPPPQPRMQPGEVRLLLQLVTALKLMLAPVTTSSERKRGATLLYNYLVGYKQMYGIEAMVPNHHFASHLPAQLDEFATVYEIWAFLAERLNKTLKATNLNNRRGGQQEVTMMREYHRDIALRSMVEHVASTPGPDTVEHRTPRAIAQRFGYNSREARGTVETAATLQDNGDRVRDDALIGATIHPGPRSAHPVTVSTSLRDGMLAFYNTLAGSPRDAQSPAQIYHRHNPNAPRNAVFLDTVAHTVRYVIVNGRRITPGTSSAIVKVALPHTNTVLAGDVVALLSHTQTGFAALQIFAEMSWMVSQQSMVVAGDPWVEFPELDICYWTYQARILVNSNSAPLVIPAQAIICQLARGICTITTPRLWITTTLDKAIPLFFLGRLCFELTMPRSTTGANLDGDFLYKYVH
ncbi:hypothetical protein C2E23DRAFT_880266 [Lenzites betulinus]|nr:hypothetical protein C2E23DRAFT_880266 [Lenzites betulinus]